MPSLAIAPKRTKRAPSTRMIRQEIPMDTQLDEIHGALKRTRQLIVGGAPL
jgi:hypothetical protein